MRANITKKGSKLLGPILQEVEAAPGSPYKIWVCKSAPTNEQRALMASRAIELNGTQRYVKLLPPIVSPIAPTKEELDEMARKLKPEVAEIQKEFGLKPVEERMAEVEERKGASPETPKVKHAAPHAAKKSKGGKAEKPAAKAPSKKGRPSKVEDPKQKYVVVKDNTRSGHMKTFMVEATKLKKFTRAELVGATKTKVTAVRAERYFDYCLYKGLIKAA